MLVSVHKEEGRCGDMNVCTRIHMSHTKSMGRNHNTRIYMTIAQSALTARICRRPSSHLHSQMIMYLRIKPFQIKHFRSMKRHCGSSKTTTVGLSSSNLSSPLHCSQKKLIVCETEFGKEMTNVEKIMIFLIWRVHFTIN